MFNKLISHLFGLRAHTIEIVSNPTSGLHSRISLTRQCCRGEGIGARTELLVQFKQIISRMLLAPYGRFYFDLGFIISLILSRVNRKVGRKRDIPEKNHITTRKQNLACLTCDSSEAPIHSGEMTCDLER